MLPSTAPRSHQRGFPAPERMSFETEAPCKLDTIIVGCGISGLCLAYLFGKAGHRVTILESASTLKEIGAGIILQPNVSKLLIRWGLKEKLESVSVKTRAGAYLKYDTGERVGTRSHDQIEIDYGASSYQIHRADLQKILCDLAFSSPNVKLRLNSRVTSVLPDPPSPRVILQSGEEISGDMVIGADGVRSIVRECVVGAPDAPVPSGDALYRVVLDAEPLLADPDLRPFVEDSDIQIWMGPRMAVIGYAVRSKKEYNIVMPHPDTMSTESWTAEGDIDEMLKMFEGWDPRLRKIQALVKSVLNFRLLVRDPLESWIHPDGVVGLIGDACHPMLPYLAQGGSMAIEDAAVLGNLFAHITSKAEIAAFFRAYETLRYRRATEIQLGSVEAGKMIRGDREKSQQHDASNEDSMLKNDGSKDTPSNSTKERSIPRRGASKAEEDALFGYDAERVAAEWWDQYKRTIAD